MLLDTRDHIPPPDQLTKTFVALRPPKAIAEQFHSRAAQLCSRAGIAGSRRPSFILHVTLLMIGEHQGRLPRMLLEKIDRAVSMVRFPAIDIALDEARSFETRRDSAPFVLEGYDLTGVRALYLVIRDALLVKGFNVSRRNAYAPHMTLAYARQRSPRIKIDPFSWRACEFQLIESWVGSTKYVELARWRLRDDEASQPEPGLPGSVARRGRQHDLEGSGAA